MNKLIADTVRPPSQLRYPAEQHLAVLFRVGRYHGYQLTHATLRNQELDRPTTDLAILNVLLPQVLGIQQYGDRLPTVRAVNVRLLKCPIHDA